jgi:hypothetical protein
LSPVSADLVCRRIRELISLRRGSVHKPFAGGGRQKFVLFSSGCVGYVCWLVG